MRASYTVFFFFVVSTFEPWSLDWDSQGFIRRRRRKTWLSKEIPIGHPKGQGWNPPIGLVKWVFRVALPSFSWRTEIATPWQIEEQCMAESHPALAKHDSLSPPQIPMTEWTHPNELKSKVCLSPILLWQSVCSKCDTPTSPPPIFSVEFKK